MAIRKIWDKEKNAWVPVSISASTVQYNTTELSGFIIAEIFCYVETVEYEVLVVSASVLEQL